MKTLAGGRQGNLKSFAGKDTSYPQAAIGWVLGNSNVDCAVMSMRSFSHVEEYLGASGRRLDRADLAILRSYQKEVDGEYCRVTCDKCESSCPKNVAISDIMRYKMYYEDYGHEKVALDNYAALEKGRKPVSCSTCTGQCLSACPYGLDVKARLIETHNMLSV
jgi:hypothetical protein